MILDLGFFGRALCLVAEKIDEKGRIVGFVKFWRIG